MTAPGAVIYLDDQATTPVDPAVAEAMAPWQGAQFGNPASTHAAGAGPAAAVELAQRQVARLAGCDPDEVVFTSGATESNNLAIVGAFDPFGESRGGDRGGRRGLVTSAIEHSAVLAPCRRLARAGLAEPLTLLPVGPDGRLPIDRLRDAVGPTTRLISLAAANNEIGSLNDLAGAAEIAHRHGALLHSDAAQQAGKLPLDAAGLDVDLISLSAHKLYGPKGIGALIVRGRARGRLSPLMVGGGAQAGLRPGTLPVPLIVGFGAACEIAARRLAEDAARIARLRDRLFAKLRAAVGGIALNGPEPPDRLPGNLNLAIDFVEGESLLRRLPDVALSTGSACSAKDGTPSHVIAALGPDGAERAQRSIRLSPGRFTTEADIDAAAARIAAEISVLRELNPFYELHQAGIDPDAPATAAPDAGR
jgi:cysteine desulfurase